MSPSGVSCHIRWRGSQSLVFIIFFQSVLERHTYNGEVNNRKSTFPPKVLHAIWLRRKLQQRIATQPLNVDLGSYSLLPVGTNGYKLPYGSGTRPSVWTTARRLEARKGFFSSKSTVYSVTGKSQSLQVYGGTVFRSSGHGFPFQVFFLLSISPLLPSTEKNSNQVHNLL